MSELVNTYVNQYKNNPQRNAQQSAKPTTNYNRNNQALEQDTGLLDSLGNYAKGVKNWIFGTASKLNPDVKEMFVSVSAVLNPEGRELLYKLHKNGKLLSRDSNDRSSTLENLYKIVTEPRVPVFDRKNIVKETLKTLNDPYIITQNIGQIPHSKLTEILETENRRLQEKIQKSSAKKYFNPDNIGDTYPIKPKDLFNIHGSTCPAASIEFNLADRRPAEFVRYVEGLTSPKQSVKTRVKYADLSQDTVEALSALTQQNSDFKPINWETVEVTIKPDQNAYLRADIQEDYRVKNTRSMIDVLIQSAFMQLGSRKTYNSLTDKRSKEVGGGEGLNQFEIAFVESIVDSESRKIPVVYMELDNDLTKVLNYSFDFEQTKKHFLKSLKQGQNIITGFLIDVDNNGNVITPQGHEILLTGYKYDENGKLWFKYNDTDDGDYFKPSWIEADSFIPKVHHANVPQNVLKEIPKQIPIGYLYLREYKALQDQKNSVKNTI